VISTVDLRRRDLVDDLEHPVHQRARPDDVAGRELVAQAQAQAPGLGLERLGLEHPVDHDQQLLEVERLGQVLDRAGPHGLDRGLDRAEGGHDHHRRRVFHRVDLLDQLDAVHAGHLQVGQDHVR
jgi:hypothetical protein